MQERSLNQTQPRDMQQAVLLVHSDNYLPTLPFEPSSEFEQRIIMRNPITMAVAIVSKVVTDCE